MNRQLQFCVILSFVMSGCGIGGHWMNGYPFPEPITPYLQKWEKAGVSPEMRRDDAFNCGGKRSDTHPDQVDNDEELRLPNENIFDTRKRLLEIWQTCMREKGYHYEKQK